MCSAATAASSARPSRPRTPAAAPDLTASGAFTRAVQSNKTPETLARTALREFVEDYWDMLEVKRRARSRGKTIPWPEVKKQLGLAR